MTQFAPCGCGKPVGSWTIRKDDGTYQGYCGSECWEKDMSMSDVKTVGELRSHDQMVAAGYPVKLTAGPLRALDGKQWNISGGILGNDYYLFGKPIVVTGERTASAESIKEIKDGLVRNGWTVTKDEWANWAERNPSHDAKAVRSIYEGTYRDFWSDHEQAYDYFLQRVASGLWQHGDRHSTVVQQACLRATDTKRDPYRGK